MKLRSSVVVAVLLTALALPMRAEILEQVLVKVNGDIFTKTDLEQRQIVVIRQKMNQQVNMDALKNDEALKKVLAEVTPGILVEAVDEILMLQLGKEKGHRLSDEQFKSWLEGMRKENNLIDDQKFQAALKQEGMTLDELRKNLEKQFLVSQVQRDEVGSKLQITEEEARQYYLLHKEEFAEPATVTLREIMIEIPTTTQGGQAGVKVGNEDEAEKKAAAIRARVLAGEDFAKLAADVSDGPSKANGGLVGPLNLTEVSPALLQTLEKMKQGEVTQPIRTARGFQILKLESLKAASVQSFDSVRDIVADKVHDARQRTEVRKFLTRVRGQAIIEWKNEELRKMYEKQIAAAATPSL